MFQDRMSRMVVVCYLVLAVGILCECAKTKGKDPVKDRQTCKWFKNDTDRMQGLGNFTDYWKNSPQAKTLLDTAQKLFCALQSRPKDELQKTVLLFGMDFSKPDLCCRNMSDCSSNVTQRLGLFRVGMEKARARVTTNLNMNILINETLDKMKDALDGQAAVVGDVSQKIQLRNVCSTVRMDRLCNGSASDLFENGDAAQGTLRFLSEELLEYLSGLNDFRKQKLKPAKVRCQNKKKGKESGQDENKPTVRKPRNEKQGNKTNKHGY